MIEKFPASIFFATNQSASDFRSYRRFRVDESDKGAPMAIAEDIIPQATVAGKSIIKRTGTWELKRFLDNDSAPVEAKKALVEWQDKRNAERT